MEIIKNGIYAHYKTKHLYRVTGMAYHVGASAPIVIYHRCDEGGVFVSIRENSGTPAESIVPQPFYRDIEDWNSHPLGQPHIKRFELIKLL